MSWERVIAQLGADPQESELAMQLNASGRSLEEFLTGGEMESRSHLKERLHFMNPCEEPLPAVKVGHNDRLQTLDINCC